MSDLLKKITEALLEGEEVAVAEQTRRALAEGVPPVVVMNEALLHGMNVIGEMWKNDEVYMPEVLIAAQAMHAGMDVLKPYLAAAGVEAAGKVVLGTVKGDLHDIGKNLVNMMFVGAGMEVIDLGVDVHEDTFVEAVKQNHPDIVAMCALLTTTMGEMSVVNKALQAAGVRDTVKVMIGGAPVTERFAAEIGVDAYAPDAAVAAEIARKMIGSRQ